LIQETFLGERFAPGRIKKRKPDSKWESDAIKSQGDIVYKCVLSMNLTANTRASVELIVKTLAKMGHDFTTAQVRAGAENAKARGLLSKEGSSAFYVTPQKVRYV
jgi:hypothetical protein